MLHLTFSNSIEAADGERRIISGKIAPYNEVGYTSAGPVVFERGSIAIADATKIKLLMQHQSTQPVGRMVANSVQDGTDGIYASFKISRIVSYVPFSR
jgi:phage head maturation protease